MGQLFQVFGQVDSLRHSGTLYQHRNDKNTPLKGRGDFQPNQVGRVL